MYFQEGKVYVVEAVIVQSKIENKNFTNTQKPNLKNFSRGLNLRRSSNMVGST